MIKNLLPILFFFSVFVFADNYTYIKGPSLIKSSTKTQTDGGTITLNSTSNMILALTGTLTEIVLLPNTASIPVGSNYEIQNGSTQSVLVKDSNSVLLETMTASSSAKFDLLSGGIWNHFSSSGQTDLSPVYQAIGTATATERLITLQQIATATSTMYLNDLLDVDTTTANNGDVLTKTAGGYVFQAPVSGGITVLSGDGYFTNISGNTASLTITATAVTGKLLEGYSKTGSLPITATDSILSSLGKLENNIYAPFVAYGKFTTSGSPNFANKGLSVFTHVTKSDLVLVPSTASGSYSAKIACADGTAPTGTTCSGADEAVGVVVPVTAGKLYRACFNWLHVQNAGTSTWVVASTASSSSSISIDRGVSNSNISGTYSERTGREACNIFYAGKTEERAFRLEYSTNTTSLTFEVDGSLSGINFIGWSVMEIH